LPVRADLPGALDHAGGEVDEFDAALIRGAEGVPVEDEPAVATNGSEPAEDGPEGPAAHAHDAGDEGSAATEATPPESTGEVPLPDGAGESEPAAESDGQELPERPAGASYAVGAEALEDEQTQEDLHEEEEEEEERRRPAARRAPGAAPERRGGIHRAIAFLRASWAELHRVQWPDRPQVTQATAVVLGFVAVAGVYLGLSDLVAKSLVEAIL
jgi:preprotein translocase SecE subunit